MFLIVSIYIAYIINLRSIDKKEERKIEEEKIEEKRKIKGILDLNWKGAQPPEREKFMPWMDED